jgi:hypothetical protein
MAGLEIRVAGVAVHVAVPCTPHPLGEFEQTSGNCFCELWGALTQWIRPALSVSDIGPS